MYFSNYSCSQCKRDGKAVSRYDVSQLLNMQLQRKCGLSYDCADSAGADLDHDGRLKCYDRTQAVAVDPSRRARVSGVSLLQSTSFL